VHHEYGRLTLATAGLLLKERFSVLLCITVLGLESWRSVTTVRTLVGTAVLLPAISSTPNSEQPYDVF